MSMTMAISNQDFNERTKCMNSYIDLILEAIYEVITSQPNTSDIAA